MMPVQAKLPLVQKLRQALLKDPKRSSVLAGLGVVMLVLWARLLLNGPASATASLIRRSVAAITDSPAPMMRGPSSNPVLDWLAQPKRPVQRNLFAIKLDYYARAAGKTASSESQDDPTKPPADEADQARQQQILLDNLQTQAAKLKLQTTLMGTTPRAMVNGQLVKEGDTVEGFTVVKIAPRKITVQQDGAVLEIEMP
jgi:hypothetical protein